MVGARGRAGGGAVAPGDIRNVVLVGHAGAGKTTLLEALLAGTGAIHRPGRVDEGTTVGDHEDIARRLGRSVALTAASTSHEGVRITLLDTPGHPDFVGEVRAGLRAADAALFVVSAVDGVDAATVMLWDECASVGMPRAVVVTHLDRPRAEFETALAICTRLFGAGVHPLYLPLLDDTDAPAGLIGLLTERVYDSSTGTRVERDADPEHLEAIEEARQGLIEGIIQESEDDGLLDRWLAGDEVDEEVLVRDLERAVARGAFHPVLPVDALTGLGVTELLEVLVRGFPTPLEHPLPAVTTPDGDPREPLDCDPGAPLVAEVVGTAMGPGTGRVALVRVFSGTLVPGEVVHVCRRPAGAGRAGYAGDGRATAVWSVLGAVLTPLERAGAGDVIAVTGLSGAGTGDTLSSPATPALMEPWVMPEPMLPTAVTARDDADADQLLPGLAWLAAEDPAVRVEIDPDTGQFVMWSMGETHLEALLDRLHRRHGVEVDTAPVRVALRETLAGPGRGQGRHVRQSACPGQFAVCDVEVEPLPEGSGIEFVDRAGGGQVPGEFVGSVEKGVRTQLARGVGAGYPMVDVRVTLVGGLSHDVDSSDAAFQAAGGLAVREAAEAAGVSMLEPVDEVRVVVGDEYVGSVLGDLSSRRGRVTGTAALGNGRTEVTGEVPAIELTRYAVDLRSVAHGTGTFTRRYTRHAPMPAQQARAVLASA